MPTFKEVANNLAERKSIWENMTASFVAAEVPLNIFGNDSVRQWIQDNVKLGQTLPCVTTLRNNLVKIGADDITQTKLLCKDMDVAFIADESTDIKNWKILNVLVKPLGTKPTNARLVFTQIVEHCDNVAISQAVIEAKKLIEVSSGNVVVFKSDNAKAIIKAAKTLMGIYPRMIHSTCWSHVIHLVAEEIRGHFTTVDKFIASLKASLVKAPARRCELLEILQRYNFQSKLPPFPVITRWCTWLQCAEFIFERFKPISEWINTTEQDAVAIKSLKDLVKKKQETLETQFKVLAEIIPGLCTALRTLESNSITTDVWTNLNVALGLSTLVFETPSIKLEAYMSNKHPGRKFWKKFPFLDPRKLSNYESIPKSLQKISKTKIPDAELATYKQLAKTENYGPEFDVKKFWNLYSREMPTLAMLAATALAVPSSTSDVERSFSVLRRTVTSFRSNLKEENIGIHLRLEFNGLTSLENEEEEHFWDEDY